MADARRKRQDLTPDELAPSADEQPGALTIVGILGEGTETGTVRLFLDAGFQTYYEIPSDAILRRTRIPAERSPLGVDSSAVVVRKGTELVVHSATTRRVEEEFLAGDFTAPGTFVPAATAGDVVLQPTPTALQRCDTMSERCVSGIVACPTRTERCVSGIVACPPPTRTERCISGILPCQTRTERCISGILPCPPPTPQCPTQPTGCPGPRCMPTWFEICQPTFACTRGTPCITRAPSICCVSDPVVCPSRGVPCHSDPLCFDPTGFQGGGDPGPIVG